MTALGILDGAVVGVVLEASVGPDEGRELWVVGVLELVVGGLELGEVLVPEDVESPVSSHPHFWNVMSKSIMLETSV